MERLLCKVREDTLRNETKERGFEDKSRKRIRHSDAQCKNNQSILGIVPGLNRVIPVVEHLIERTNEADQQGKRNSYSRHPRSHRHEYTPTAAISCVTGRRF
jgi:hypothetical protein